ncbi:NAD(P)/FAD-dependent oxidoreductase [Paenibacillus sp. N4]|uniref:NAD(P)/FAD-dependent oxidoreductase n=1 Tax=Paenibacillus vietnamensis TaxID=2590547 RepID=UPI001CD0EAE8|nr:NAD(P)/FAD-dependent oxidoreductase [Paenibacillus vietnamensis]MCA0754318.1 NAD(P)/FAD-dependent oxidoreductase [Paenibacillus vietnamensis]
MQVDCLIVGGGIAGLQAAIQLGRYCRRVTVVDAAEGRSTMCRSYHNIIGWPDGVSGPELLASGREQAKRLGVQFVYGKAAAAAREEGGFTVTLEDSSRISAKRLLLATGVKDRLPPFPALLPCLGVSVYVCPDCDGYEVWKKRTVVLGAGNTGASMALALTHWTSELTYVNHEQSEVEESVRRSLDQKGIVYIETSVREVLAEQSQLSGFILDDGTRLEARHAFVALGGNQVRSGLAEQLGARLMDNRHIVVDPRTKMTSVPHVWAAGDVTAHSEMSTIAMGDGSQAAIWINKSLL